MTLRLDSLGRNVVLDTAVFMRPMTREKHLGQGYSPETGYVDADQHVVQHYPCRRGGPYVFARNSVPVEEPSQSGDPDQRAALSQQRL